MNHPGHLAISKIPARVSDFWLHISHIITGNECQSNANMENNS